MLSSSSPLELVHVEHKSHCQRIFIKGGYNCGLVVLTIYSVPNCRDIFFSMSFVIRKSNLALADDTVDVRSEPLDDFTQYF